MFDRRRAQLFLRNIRTRMNFSAKKQVFLKGAVLIGATLFLKTLLYVDISATRLVEDEGLDSDLSLLTPQSTPYGNFSGAGNKCKAENVSANMEVNIRPATLQEVLGELRDKPRKGAWSPSDCKRESKIAIIVPFRNRDYNLPIFLRHMHNFLQRQKRSYRIFVIEQNDDLLFNRGSLINVGYKEAIKHDNYTCLIIHDVDMLPENAHISYNCVKAGAIHMSNRLSSHNYSNIYGEYVGGVMSIKPKVFERINGYANTFWGWGGEDDEFLRRILYAGVKFYRQSAVEGRYFCLSLGKSEQVFNKKRFEILKSAPKRFKSDGLRSLVYDVIEVNEEPLYTKVSVSLLKLRDLVHEKYKI